MGHIVVRVNGLGKFLGRMGDERSGGNAVIACARILVTLLHFVPSISLLRLTPAV